MATVTIGGVGAEIYALKERTTERGLEAHVTYQCAWGSRHNFLLGLAGDVQQVGSGTDATISRRVPHAYQDSPPEVTLYAQLEGIEIDPVGPIVPAPSGWVTIGKVGPGNGLARISVVYAVLDYDPDDSTAYEESLDGAGQSVTLPGRPYTVGGVSLGQDQAAYLPQIDVQRTFVDVPTVDDRLWTTIGRVNDAPFRGQAAGTFLMGPPQVRHRRTVTGTRTNQVTVSLMFRPRPWNHAPHPTTGVWGLVSPLFYEEASFAWLG